MYFIIDCTDHADRGDVRRAVRHRHLEWLATVKDKILSAGPKLDDTGKHPIGSLLIIDFPDRQAARHFADRDPYALAGLFSGVVIHRYRQVLPVSGDRITDTKG